MKFILSVACLILAVNAISDSELWAEYKITHNKAYDAVENEFRLKIFLSKKQEIEEHNARYAAGQETYYKGINQFSDRTPQERKSMLKQSLIFTPPKDVPVYNEVNSSIPDAWDWRTYGIIGPIQTQLCNDCWAHAIAGVTAAYYALKSQLLYTLSRQNLLDCTFTFQNYGCLGGNAYLTYQYLLSNGIMSEHQYRYEHINSYCRFNASAMITKITGFHVAGPNNEEAMRTAIATKGPLAIMMDAEGDFMDYHGGIYSKSTCSKETHNHEVLIIGYGIENDVPYWLIKNQYGPTWGEEGYMKMIRNVNMCGIANYPTYPDVV